VVRVVLAWLSAWSEVQMKAFSDHIAWTCYVYAVKIPRKPENPLKSQALGNSLIVNYFHFTTLQNRSSIAVHMYILSRSLVHPIHGTVIRYMVRRQGR